MPLYTQEEYSALKDTHAKELKAVEKDLQTVCTMLANNMPVKFWGRTEATIWGCILNKDPENNSQYCDECPAEKFCRYDGKHFSK